MRDDLLAITQKSLSIFKPLKEAVLIFINGDKANGLIRKHTKVVCDQESEVDRLEWDITKMIFISKLEFSHILHLKNCLDTIVEVSDRAEDTGDQVELVALKSIG